MRQLAALAAGAARELAWGLPGVAREVRAWRVRAAKIPDAAIREDALGALARKRGNVDGAALFWIVPRVRSASLLRLLATYQIMWDFLDNASERGAMAGRANGRQLHLALVDALDPSRAISDYYRYHPWCDDGGYLRALVEACRDCFAQMPSYGRVRSLLVREAFRANIQAINHDRDPARRRAALQVWAAREFSGGHEASWYELAGAAGAGLAIYALLVLGVEPACSDSEVARAHGAYFPWVSVVATMLDSYVDRAEDAANRDHVYVEHYPTPEVAVLRMRELVRRSLIEVRSLAGGERHVVIVACMVAMYLSRDSARTTTTRESTARLVLAGGSLTGLLLPILRLWRIAYAQRST